MESKKLVLFGAGKIGRSFIGQLFSRAGYEVVFIDIDDKVISALNEHRKYKVVVKNDIGDELIWVKNVRGIHSSDIDEIVKEIASTDILAMSVGQNAIPKIAPTIAKGIELRHEKDPESSLDIILAENLRDAAKVVQGELVKNLNKTISIQDYIGLIETSIGKMVPMMPAKEIEKDPLVVYAEPYNTLILDKKAFRNPIPNIDGLAPKEHMPAWVDRKSFIHNLGHAAAAYCGNIKYPRLVYLYEIMDKKDVYNTARITMLQAADILMAHYPQEFTINQIVDHIDDLLERFSNRALGDTVFRVGQDLYRKLGPEDRLVGALKLALKYRMPYDRILYIIACAMKFSATNEQGFRSKNDEKFRMEAKKGISHVLESVCMIDPERYPQVHAAAKKITN